MFIVNIEYPGTWLKLQDTEKTSDVESLLSSMDTSLIDMAITLTMFVDCQQNSYSEHTSENIEVSWERDRQLRIQIEKNYRDGLANENDFYSNHEHHRAETKNRGNTKKL